MLLKFIRKGAVPSCYSICPQVDLDLRLQVVGKPFKKRPKSREKKIRHAKSVIFWFGFRVGWVAVVTRQWQPSVAEKFLAWDIIFLAWEGGHGGVCAPLHERTGQNSAGAGTAAA